MPITMLVNFLSLTLTLLPLLDITLNFNFTGLLILYNVEGSCYFIQKTNFLNFFLQNGYSENNNILSCSKFIKHSFMVFAYFETLKESIDRYENNPNIFYHGWKQPKILLFCNV